MEHLKRWYVAPRKGGAFPDQRVPVWLNPQPWREHRHPCLSLICLSLRGTVGRKRLYTIEMGSDSTGGAHTGVILSPCPPGNP